MGLIIKNANKINEGAIEMVDVLIENEIIQKNTAIDPIKRSLDKD